MSRSNENIKQAGFILRAELNPYEVIPNVDASDFNGLKDAKYDRIVLRKKITDDPKLKSELDKLFEKAEKEVEEKVANIEFIKNINAVIEALEKQAGTSKPVTEKSPLKSEPATKPKSRPKTKSAPAPRPKPSDGGVVIPSKRDIL